MRLSEHKNSKKQGDAGLGVAISWFATEGYSVSIPLTDSQDYDLVVEFDGTLKKVQVKTTTHKLKSGSYCVYLNVKGGNRSGTGKTKQFDPTRADFLFIYLENGIKYLIPTIELGKRSSIAFSKMYDSYKV